MAAEATAGIDVDLFREDFKRYKRRQPPPDFSDVVDFSDELKTNNKDIKRLNLQEACVSRPCGLQPAEEWKAYTHASCPGFVYICNPFEAGYQRYWVYRCLHDYPSKPNVSNLDFIEQQCGIARPDNLWDASQCFDRKEENINNKNKVDLKTSSLVINKFHFDKLRWVTLGYHYNWNDKTYNKQEVSEFPKDLSFLAKYIAAVVGFPKYCPEAAITNYYHMDSTLAGHTDHSEFDHEAPIISISFGQDAVFLLGGVTKAVRPVAIHLRSGDICIMAGNTRRSYHAVPRMLRSKIFKSSFETAQDVKWSDADCSSSLQTRDQTTPDTKPSLPTIDDHDCVDVNQQILTTLRSLLWSEYETYLENSRINISVRQVLKAGQEFPEPPNSND